MSILHLSPYFYCSVLYSARIGMLVLISHTAHCVYTLMSAVYNYQSTITYSEISSVIASNVSSSVAGLGPEPVHQ